MTHLDAIIVLNEEFRLLIVLRLHFLQLPYDVGFEDLLHLLHLSHSLFQKRDFFLNRQEYKS
jgi:hypothetical protein